MSEIQWTDRTWNPIVGCSKVSPGCDACYAMGDSPHRFKSKYERDGVVVIRGKATRPGMTFVPRSPDGKSLGKGAQWTGELRLLPWQLDVPLRRKKPTTWFVNSLSDIFHESLVDCEEGRRFIAAIFGVMAATPQHTYQLLTKRPAKAREWFAWLDGVTLGHPRLLFQYLDDLAWERPDIVIPQLQGCGDRRVEWPLPNVWIGTSVEDQRRADERIPELLRVPAALRFLSCEPLLGPLDLGEWLAAGDTWDGFDETGYREDAPLFDSQEKAEAWMIANAKTPWSVEVRDRSDRHPQDVYSELDWVICGGESGPKSRPCDVSWLRSIVEQCREAGVACFVKQLGAHVLSDEDFPMSPSVDGRVRLDSAKGGDEMEWPEDLRVREMPDRG